MPAGRPTKYTPDMCDTVIRCGKEGKSYTAMASQLGITRDTLYRWQEKYDEFSDALKIARQYAQEWWESTLQTQAMTGRGNAASAIFAMKNQFPDEYKDKRDHHVEGQLGVFEIDFTGYDEGTADDSEDWEQP